MNLNFALNLRDLRYLDFINKDRLLDLTKIDNQLNQGLIDFLKINFKQANIDRVYFGGEFCEFLTPVKEQLENFIKLLAAKGITFTYTTGYLTLNNEDIIKENLNYLNSLNDNTFEVVINDYALWDYFINNNFNLKPIVGRLLLKIKNNPYENDGVHPDLPDFLKIDAAEVIKKQKKFYQTMPVLDFFQKYSNILDFEVDNPDLVNNNDLSLNLHLPWSYMTSGRNCLIARNKDEKYSFPVKSCKKECLSNYYLFSQYDNLLQFENTVYKNNLNTVKDLRILKNLNRLVLTLF